jgi:hypothetical protein
MKKLFIHLIDLIWRSFLSDWPFYYCQFFSLAADLRLIAFLCVLETCPGSPNDPVRTDPTQNCNLNSDFFVLLEKANWEVSWPDGEWSQSVFLGQGRS